MKLLFAKIERNMIARGIFTSTANLRRKLMQYIRQHNKTCQPIQWAYSNPKHRILLPEIRKQFTRRHHLFFQPDPGFTLQAMTVST